MGRPAPSARSDPPSSSPALPAPKTPNNRLSVHIYNGSSLFDYWRPNLLGAAGLGAGMNVGGKLNDTVTQLIISFVGVNATHAQVRFCR